MSYNKAPDVSVFKDGKKINSLAPRFFWTINQTKILTESGRIPRQLVGALMVLEVLDSHLNASFQLINTLQGKIVDILIK